MRVTLLTLALSMAFVSCGERTRTNTKIKEVPGPTVEVPGPTEVVEKEVPVAQDFEGIFLLSHNGYMELLQSEDGEVTFNSHYQHIISRNYNRTYATHPRISGRYKVNDGIVFFGKDVDYKSSGEYDLESDRDNSNITGKRYTTFRLEFRDDGKLMLTITIYSNKKGDNLNHILARRKLVQQ